MLLVVFQPHEWGKVRLERGEKKNRTDNNAGRPHMSREVGQSPSHEIVPSPHPIVRVHAGIDLQEEKLELQPEFDRKLAKRIETAGKTGELNFMMEGLNYFPMGVFQEGVRSEVSSFDEKKMALKM